MALFLDEEANTFPPGQEEGDYKIELLETAPASFNCKVYPLSKAEQEAEDKFLDENSAKGYIILSNSPYGFSTFMVPKKDLKEKRYIINYRPLNAVTRKDVTPLPNLAQCIKDLQELEIFSKFDICCVTIRFCPHFIFYFPLSLFSHMTLCHMVHHMTCHLTFIT